MNATQEAIERLRKYHQQYIDLSSGYGDRAVYKEHSGYLADLSLLESTILDLTEQVRVRDKAMGWIADHSRCFICESQAKCNLGESATCPTDEEFIEAALDAAKEKGK